MPLPSLFEKEARLSLPHPPPSPLAPPPPAPGVVSRLFTLAANAIDLKLNGSWAFSSGSFGFSIFCVSSLAAFASIIALSKIVMRDSPNMNRPPCRFNSCADFFMPRIKAIRNAAFLTIKYAFG